MGKITVFLIVIISLLILFGCNKNFDYEPVGVVKIELSSLGEDDWVTKEINERDHKAFLDDLSEINFKTTTAKAKCRGDFKIILTFEEGNYDVIEAYRFTSYDQDGVLIKSEQLACNTDNFNELIETYNPA